VPELEIAFEDRDLLVAVKPAGLATTAPHDGPSLTRTLGRMRPGMLHPSSRLDAEVTGLVTYAKTKRAIESLRRARAAGRYGRGYLALAASSPPAPEGLWEASIALDARDPTLRVAVSPGGTGTRLQDAKSGFRVRETVGGVVALWLTPYTGRTHQLRVHAAHAGAPLLGDVRYGGPKRVVLEDGRVLGARRVMLHCAWLRLPAVEGGGSIELRRAPPDDLRDLWLGLGGTLQALRAEPGPSSP
jgi:23S rRNA-/tRNA-specific pseudouridylate synthase